MEYLMLLDSLQVGLGVNEMVHHHRDGHSADGYIQSTFEHGQINLL